LESEGMKYNIYIYVQQVLALNQGMVSSYTYAQAGGFRNGTGSRVAEVPAPFDSEVSATATNR